MNRIFRRVNRSERGASMVEYGLLVAAILVIAYGASHGL